MIQAIKSISKEHTQPINEGKLVLFEENIVHHADFMVVSWLIHELENKNKVIFIGLRQNYAHYLSLSKKMGKSIEPFLKSDMFIYYEAFMHEFCGELPLTQSSPPCYQIPQKTIKQIKQKDIFHIEPQKNSVVLVDALSFIYDAQVCYSLYQKCILNNCRLIVGGCLDGIKAYEVLKNEAQLVIKLENDVGGCGKIRVTSSNGEVGLLWRWIQGKFQVNKFLNT